VTKRRDASPTSNTRLERRTCAWCGTWIPYSGRGRYPVYCSPSCRTRAWEIRTAEKRLGRDLSSGRASAEPVREVVRELGKPRQPPTTATPTKADQWAANWWAQLLKELARQLTAEKLGQEHWHHARLYRGLENVLMALDAVHPGGLRSLRRKR
jgi:hypothetical protein